MVSLRVRRDRWSPVPALAFVICLVVGLRGTSRLCAWATNACSRTDTSIDTSSRRAVISLVSSAVTGVGGVVVGLPELAAQAADTCFSDCVASCIATEGKQNKAICEEACSGDCGDANGYGMKPLKDADENLAEKFIRGTVETNFNMLDSMGSGNKSAMSGRLR